MDSPPLSTDGGPARRSWIPIFAPRIVGLLGLLVVSWIVFEGIVKMRLSNLMAVSMAVTGSGVSSAAVNLAWFPPNSTMVNDLSGALGGEGVYGFVYNSSYPKGVKYGTYNWCNMPHVRKEEYKTPEKEYKLKYVEVIHRHHKRTVYASNSFPVESYGWNCDDEALFFYGQPDSGRKSGHTNWQGYVSPINPFKPSGFIGTCQFPQITKEGLDDSWQHGKDLYGVYHDLLGFLPGGPLKNVEFRVTQNQITSQVSGMLINGMFDTQNDVPLLVAPAGFDSLEPTYTCVTSANLYNAEKSTTVWLNHLSAASSLYATLDDISGVSPSDSGFHASFDHYYDNLSARQCHGKPLPCKLVNGANSSTCVTQATANSVYRLGNWEYSYVYRDSPSSLNAAVGSFGVWIAELARNIRSNIAGTSVVKYRHNVAHDGSVSRLLSFLQIEQMVWPGMGAEVVFEVWEKNGKKRDVAAAEERGENSSGSGSDFYIRVLFGGQVLQSSSPTLGVLDMVPLESVLAYFDGLVGVNANLVMGKCNGGLAF